MLNGITLYIDNDVQRTEKSVTTVRSIILSTKKTHKFLNDFLTEVYQAYVEKNYKQYDSDKDARYFLTLKSESGDSSKRDYRWRRYNLNIERTFDSIFFPEKESIISLIDDFEDKRGLFSKKSIPYKLSFLLHGPPGTGKTSFLKALSNYTNRHIINISLPLIETNEQLIEVFQNDNLQVHINQDYIRSEKIPMNKRIYVLEDVDVLSDIVKKREEDKKKEESSSEDESDSSDSEEDEKEKEKRKKRKTKKVVISDLKKKTKKYGPTSSNTYGNSYERYCIQEDKLNLSGLLNALDGLLELHGVIIVLTTNHPENLDPALIRPGRITRNLGMTYMKKHEVEKMIKYHCPQVDVDELKLECYVDKITPATIENICLQSKDMQALKENLIKVL